MTEKSSGKPDPFSGPLRLPPLQNRDLSALAFHARVLAEAWNETLPVLECFRYLGIFYNNLDEFFMVRVARLLHKAHAKEVVLEPDGMRPEAVLNEIRRKLDELLPQSRIVLQSKLWKKLRESGIVPGTFSTLSGSEQHALTERFQCEILPGLIVRECSKNHFEKIWNNGTLELLMRLKPSGGKAAAEVWRRVRLSPLLPRFLKVGNQTFLGLEELILAHTQLLFPGCTVLGTLFYRVTCDMDIALEDGGGEQLSSVRHMLRKRRTRQPVRLEWETHGDPVLAEFIRKQTQLDARELYPVPDLLSQRDFQQLCTLFDRPDLCFPPEEPMAHADFPNQESIFSGIRQHRENLLALPYQSFDPVVRMLAEAADDPDVVAIEQTLYRISGNSPVASQLIRAARQGKNVTAIVELKARFDEKSNLRWARQLERSGVHVHYGIPGLKVHAKALLITRKESGKLRQYLHLATGNYNEQTARQYTDLGLFTDDPALCGEISALFRILSGGTAIQANWRKLAVAPFQLRRKLLTLIDRESAWAQSGKSGRIIMKMNSLADPELIAHLVQAAENGVKVDLVIRGICALIPANANLQVVSIVDRYLEHSRIFYFANNGQEEYYLSSADGLPRNFDRRIELMFPVVSSRNRALLAAMLELVLQHRRQTYCMNSDCRYEKTDSTESPTTQQLTRELLETQKASENCSGFPDKRRTV